MPRIDGAIGEHNLGCFHAKPSIVCVCPVDSLLDQVLVEFVSKHIHTLLNGKTVQKKVTKIFSKLLKNVLEVQVGIKVCITKNKIITLHILTYLRLKKFPNG